MPDIVVSSPIDTFMQSANQAAMQTALGTIAVSAGGTGQTTAQAAINSLMAASGSLAQGDIFYYDGSNVVKLAAGTNGYYLKTNGTGANPSWAAVSAGSVAWGAITGTLSDQTDLSSALSGKVATTTTVNGHALSGNVTVTKSDVGLGSVENTALSTWAGTTNVTTLGTVATGTWNGTAIGLGYIAQGGATSGQVLSWNGSAWAPASAGGTGTVTSVAASVPSFLSVSGSPITSSGTLAISYSGTALPYANGGTNATSQADAVTNMSGAKVFASGAAISAATPTLAGQMAIGTDGSMAWGFNTSAGGYVSGGVSLLNPTIYISTLSLSTALAQTGGTSQLKSLTVSTGNLEISAGSLVANATGTTGQHSLVGSHNSDDAVAISNAQAGGFSAIRFKYDGDGEGKLACGVANSGTGANWNGQKTGSALTYWQFFDEDGVNASPDFQLRQFGVYSPASAQDYVRMWIKSDGTFNLYGLSAGNLNGPVAIGIANTGDVTLAPTSAGTVTIGGGATASELRFLEPSGSGTNYTAFKAQAQASDITYTLPAASSNGLLKNSSGTLSWGASGTDYVHPSQANTMCSGRLTLTSATPVLTTSVTGAATVYFTPYKGNSIALYDGSAWKAMTFSELSITLSTLSASTAYDVWAYDNSGTVALDTTAWTNSTTRATAIAYQDGVAVKSGAATRRYLGSMILDGSKQVSVTFGSAAAGGGAGQFDLWNYNNRVACATTVQDTTDSWNYTTNTWRSSNNSATNRVTLFIGLSEDTVTADATGTAVNSSAVGRWTGIGLDSTSAYSGITARSAATTIQSQTAFYRGFPGIGQHYLQWLEKSNATGTCTWYGDNAADGTQSGLTVQFVY